MLVLVIWQAPIQPVVRPNGSIGLIIGAGTDEYTEFSCEGDLISSDRVAHSEIAVQADYNLNEITRIDVVAGRMSSDWSSHDGIFATTLLRVDWRVIGLGGGFAFSPAFNGPDIDPRTEAWPSGYLRIGNAEGSHLRADVFPPTAFAAQQIARVGYGYNAVRRDHPAVFVGLAGVGSNEGATGLAAEISAPVGSRFALNLQAYYGDGEKYAVNGIAVGGRYLFSVAPAAAPQSVGRR